MQEGESLDSLVFKNVARSLMACTTRTDSYSFVYYSWRKKVSIVRLGTSISLLMLKL